MEKMKLICLHISRLLLSAVFIYAGALKVFTPADFYESISAYRLLPNEFAYASAYLLPPIEIILGAGLFFKRYERVAALLILFLNILFIAAISSAWCRGLDIFCGCFGRGGSSVHAAYLSDILRDTFFILLALVVLFGAGKSELSKQGDKF